ncbi:hypothetical protein LCGC14_0956260 [marine sediment metagenome]|uniref:Uncharacterized protein n=1 Tax=marine sediment metagenome TaxID=412755 RepID=A0A0F9NFP3_9ZZZZ
MIKLKTLKDIDFKQNANSYRFELRREVIKWVKAIRDDPKILEKMGFCIYYEIWDSDSILLRFFNITEEDLK